MFSSLTVVELASVLAGPSVGTFFAELGAKVIKVENMKTDGDVTRNWRITGETKPISAYYSAVNWNKEVLMMDLTDSLDRTQLHEHIKTADVVISNYKPGDAEKLGMDFQTLKELNPSLIYASLKGFVNQPDRVAYDVVLQAETGFMYMNGSPTSGPIKMPVALIDIIAGHQLKEAILIALLKKAQTGLGSYIETSLEEAALASLANQATNWLMNGHDPQPLGSIHPNIAPYGELFLSKDGVPFALAVGSDSQFSSLCDVLNLSELITDLKFLTNQSRVKNRVDLANRIADKFKSLPFSEIVVELEKHKIPYGKIKSVKEVMQSETAKSMILEQVIDGQPTQRLKSIAFNRFWLVS